MRIKEDGCAWMYLHEVEKTELFNRAYAMKTSFETLKNMLSTLPDELECKSLYRKAQQKMLDIEAPIVDQGVYEQDVQKYGECTKALQTARWKLTDETNDMSKEKFEQLKNQSEACRVKQYRFKQAWDDINTFTRKCKYPEASRRGNYHATFTTFTPLHAETTMDGLLRDLKILGT